MKGLYLFCVVAVGALGCGDGGGSPGPDMATPVQRPHNFQQISEQVLQPSCADFSVCHSTRGAQDTPINLCGAPDPNTNRPGGAVCKPTAALIDAYNALVGVASKNDQAKAEGLQVVKPCDPDKSFLIIKLKLPVTATDAKVGYGQHMPKDNPALPQEQLDGIRDWIARGAKLNEPADVTGSSCTPADLGTKD